MTLEKMRLETRRAKKFTRVGLARREHHVLVPPIRWCREQRYSGDIETRDFFRHYRVWTTCSTQETTQSSWQTQCILPSLLNAANHQSTSRHTHFLIHSPHPYPKTRERLQLQTQNLILLTPTHNFTSSSPRSSSRQLIHRQNPLLLPLIKSHIPLHRNISSLLITPICLPIRESRHVHPITKIISPTSKIPLPDNILTQPHPSTPS